MQTIHETGFTRRLWHLDPGEKRTGLTSTHFCTFGRKISALISALAFFNIQLTDVLTGYVFSTAQVVGFYPRAAYLSYLES